MLASAVLKFYDFYNFLALITLKLYFLTNMMKLLRSLLLMLLVPSFMMAQASLPLIPQPQNVTLRTGTFKMPKKVRIFVPAYDNDSLQGVVNNFAAQLKNSFGLEVKSAVTPKRCHIELRTNPNINDEGYRLEIEESVKVPEVPKKIVVEEKVHVPEEPKVAPAKGICLC